MYVSLDQELHCVKKPILPSLFYGGAIAAMGMIQGQPFNPRAAAQIAGFIYGYMLHVAFYFTAAERTSRF